MVVDCHHRLCLGGDRMKITFFRESPTSLWVSFMAKFWPLVGLAYSLVLIDVYATANSSCIIVGG